MLQHQKKTFLHFHGFSKRRAERRTFSEPEENSKTHSLSGLDLKFQKNLLSIKTQKKFPE